MIELAQVSRSFGARPVVTDVSLRVATGASVPGSSRMTSSSMPKVRGACRAGCCRVMPGLSPCTLDPGRVSGRVDYQPRGLAEVQVDRGK